MLHAGFTYIHWFWTGFSPVQVAAGSEIPSQQPAHPCCGLQEVWVKGLPQCSLTEAKPWGVQYRQLHSSAGKEARTGSSTQGLTGSLIVGSIGLQTLGHGCKREQKTSLVSPGWETQQLSSLEGHSSGMVDYREGTLGQDSHPDMHVYTQPHTELAIPHQGRWDGAREKPLCTRSPRMGAPDFLPTGDPAKPSVPISR